MTHDAEQRVRDRAYYLWEAAGRPHGRDQEFWAQASAEEQALESPVAPATSSGNENAAAAAAPEAKPAGRKRDAKERKPAAGATEKPAAKGRPRKS